MFNDISFRDAHHLSAVNSINWARILAQVVYYVKAAADLGAPDQAVSFTVPTGNFGNVFAGWVARRIGTPIRSLVVGSNRNDILPRFFRTGVMEMRGVVSTTSPSMDIQVSSNFERLLFELCGRDAGVVREAMAQFRDEGRVDLGPELLGSSREVFDAHRIDDDAVRRVIAATYERTGVLVDPHTAVGLGAAALHEHESGVPMVCLATADPAKFPDAVEAAVGFRPPLPDHLADLFEREERWTTLPHDLARVEEFVASSTMTS
jgi:threonine synthase